MKLTTIMFFLFFTFPGCAEISDHEKDAIPESEANSKENPISDNPKIGDNIFRVFIRIDSGYVRSGDNRFVEYDYYLDDLSPEATELILNLQTTDENLFCVNDGATYEMHIIDNNDAETIYVSNNRDCGRENEVLFVATDSILEILESL